MKLHISKFALIFLFIATASSGASKIESIDARFHVTEEVFVCGKVSQISPFSKGVYLNMDRKYPYQSIAVIVWKEDVNAVQNVHGSLSGLLNKRICVEGTITKYKDAVQIKVNNAYAIKLQ